VETALTRIAVALLLCCIAGNAAAAWDVAVTGTWGDCSPITPLYLDVLSWSGKDGSDEGGFSNIFVIAPAPDGRILGIRVRGNLADVVSVLPDREPETLGTFAVPSPARPASMVVDAFGNLIVSWSGQLMRIAQDGTILGSTPGGGEGIDVAADGCTVFVSGWTGVRRVNLCTGTYLPVFATGKEISDVKILPGGRVLVAEFDTLRIYAPNGALLRTLPIAAVRMALAGGGRTVYTTLSCGGPVRQWDLATGALLATFGSAPGDTRSIIAHDAWTAAFGAPAAAQVPTLSETATLALASLLALLALRRIM
jgi:hypothetical protein